jgi:hypothetical protein
LSLKIWISLTPWRIHNILILFIFEKFGSCRPVGRFICKNEHFHMLDRALLTEPDGSVIITSL